MIGFITRVASTPKSDYIFNGGIGGSLQILSCGNKDAVQDARHYADVEGRGHTAILRLAESHANLRQIFERMVRLAQFDPHGRLIGFVTVEDMDPDQQEQFELLAELFEERAELEGMDQ